MQDLDLRPIVLNPDMLWLKTEANPCLRLTEFGAITSKATSTVSEYCADLSSSALVPLPYAAPELIERRVITPTSESFSIGQLLSKVFFGEAQDHAFIRDGSVAFAVIPDPLLASLVMGSLWPKPEGRWSLGGLHTALESGGGNAPEAPAWESLYPGAASIAFQFNAKNYYRA